MTILAIDFGTSTGFALGYDGTTYCGTWVLSKPKEITYARKLRLHRRLDPRIPALWERIRRIHRETPLEYLVWEDVEFCSTSYQCQLWASFRTVAWIFASQNNIQADCLAVGKLKLWATGSGAADKPAMAAAALRRWPELVRGKNLGDDAIDALCLLQWARETIKI